MEAAEPPRLFAIGDLHLSFGLDPPKPMDRFGDYWRSHPQKIAAAWRDLVRPTDVVAVPGDLSWAMRFEEALPDLEWLAALPGTKVLVRGNHDYWWSSDWSAARLARQLPPGLVPLHKSVADFGRFALAGSRGWDLPPQSADDDRIIDKEERRLRASLAALPDRPDTIRVALLHHPPFGVPFDEGDDRLLAPLYGAGVAICVYGHLHRGGPTAFEGVRDRIRFVNVASDWIDFRPIRLL